MDDDQRWDEEGNFYRQHVKKGTAYRDQWTFGVRQHVPVPVYEYANGDILTGGERCQYVIFGNPSAFCHQCNVDLTKEKCLHSTKSVIRRCNERAWYISKFYGHCVCLDHRYE